MKKLNLLLLPLLLVSCGKESAYDYTLYNKVLDYMLSTGKHYDDYDHSLFTLTGSYKLEADGRKRLNLKFSDPVKDYNDIRLVAMGWNVSSVKSNEFASAGFTLDKSINFVTTLENKDKDRNKDVMNFYWYTTEEVLETKIYFSYMEGKTRQESYIKFTTFVKEQ